MGPTAISARTHPAHVNRILRRSISLLTGDFAASKIIDGLVIGSSDSEPNRYSLLIAMADEELVDQKRYLEESSKPKCVKPLLEYRACVKRIEGDDSGSKHCTGQYFDYWSCIDKSVAPKLFEKLK